MRCRYLLLTTRLYSISFGKYEEDSIAIVFYYVEVRVNSSYLLYPLINMLIFLCLSFRRGDNMRSRYLLLTTRLYFISFGKYEEDWIVIVFYCVQRSELTHLICLYPFNKIFLLPFCLSFRRGDNMGCRYLLLTTRLYSISFGKYEEDSIVIVFYCVEVRVNSCYLFISFN